MLKSRQAVYLRSSLSSRFLCDKELTEMAMGIIIMVAVMFEIHMDKKPEQTIKPSINQKGLFPDTDSIFSAILLCKPHFSMAKPMIAPPINKNIT